MSEAIKQALQSVSKQDWDEFFQEHFHKPLLKNLDAGSLAPNDFKAQRSQTQTIKNYLLTYRDK